MSKLCFDEYINGVVILHLLSAVDKSLLLWRNPFLLLNPLFDPLHLNG